MARRRFFSGTPIDTLRAECTNVDNRRIKLIHGFTQIWYAPSAIKLNSGFNSGLNRLKSNPRVSVD